MRHFITQHTWLQLIMWEDLDCSVTGDNGINMLVTENICITYCLMSKEVTLMFPDSVRSLLVRNPFSHALFVATGQVRFLIHKEHGIGWRTATDKKEKNLVQTRDKQDLKFVQPGLEWIQTKSENKKWSKLFVRVRCKLPVWASDYSRMWCLNRL